MCDQLLVVYRIKLLALSLIKFFKAGSPLPIAQEECRHSLNLSYPISLKWLGNLLSNHGTVPGEKCIKNRGTVEPFRQ